MALAGKDGKALAKLIRDSKAAGTKLMADVVAGAIKRYSGKGNLLSKDDVNTLATSLASVNATADLLGRSRVREMVTRTGSVGLHKFKDDYSLSTFADAKIGVMGTPEAALEYFLSLIPDLDVDPQRYADEQRRKAFNLAVSNNQVLTQRVQSVVAEAIENGSVIAPAGTLPDGKVVEFEPHPREGTSRRTILVDPAKLDEAWQKDKTYYIPPGGGGAEIGGRREGFKKYLEKDKLVEASEVYLNEDGSIQFGDGRHRMSVLRDAGIDQVAITVPREEAEEFERRFGVPGGAKKPLADLSGSHAVKRVLDRVGVSYQNSQYPEMVYRTNAMDSFQTGMYEEGRSDDVAELFPCYQYLGIDDERAGADHRPKFNLFYPATATFQAVRGKRPFNCRCSMRWVDKHEWADLQKSGIRVQTTW